MTTARAPRTDAEESQRYREGLLLAWLVRAAATADVCVHEVAAGDGGPSVTQSVEELRRLKLYLEDKLAQHESAWSEHRGAHLQTHVERAVELGRELSAAIGEFLADPAAAVASQAPERLQTLKTRLVVTAR